MKMEKKGKNVQVQNKYNGISSVASPYLKPSFAPTIVNQGFDLLLKLGFFNESLGLLAINKYFYNLVQNLSQK